MSLVVLPPRITPPSPSPPRVHDSDSYDTPRQSETDSGRWLAEWVLLADAGLLLGFNLLWLAVTLAGRAGQSLRPKSLFAPPVEQEAFEVGHSHSLARAATSIL